MPICYKNKTEQYVLIVTDMQTHTVVTGSALLSTLLLLNLQLSLELLQIGLQLSDAFTQAVFI